MKEYMETNICKSPTPSANPFFDIDKMNELAKEGWRVVYIFRDERFMIMHTTLKALFERDVEEEKIPREPSDVVERAHDAISYYPKKRKRADSENTSGE